MMPEVRLLSFLDEHGITLSREGPHIVAFPKQAITPEIRELIKAHKDDLLNVLGSTNDNLLTIKTPSKAAREYYMRIMTAWNERAAMMTDSTCPIEQAEIAAWHDLGMDRVFWRAVH